MTADTMTADERRARLGRVYALLLRLAAEERARAAGTPAGESARHG